MLAAQCPEDQVGELAQVLRHAGREVDFLAEQFAD